ncbi:AsmA family protein [uncultured Roseobacter sp.]|uniref:AsmA family protein n=1 Tax=uncultured Roseobacter sp. TaxID=114847 RepID=UPI00260CE1A5|nr:AsmA family protein [uncultured Roseobacter sp.]
MKRILLASLLAITVLLIGAVAFVFLVPDRHLRSFVEWAGSRTLGLEVSMDGLTTTRGLSSTVDISGLTLTEEASDTPLVAADTVTVSFDLFDVVSTTPRLDQVTISRADIHQILNAEDGASEVTALQTVIPVAVEDIQVSDLHIERSARAANQDLVTLFELSVEEAGGSVVASEAIEMEGQGTYQGAPVQFRLAAPDTADFATRDAIPIETEISGAIDASASFSLLRSGGISPIEFDVSGPTVAALAAFVPVALPETPPFSLTGTVELGEEAYETSNLSGRIGDSDVSGDLTMDLSGELPAVRGTLKSQTLDFDDLGGLIGAPPDVTETASDAQRDEAASAPVIPDTPFPVGALRAANVDLQFIAENVSAPVAQIEAIDATIRLQDSRLEINPLDLVVSSGRATGEIALNVREEVPSADIDISFADVSLNKFFAGSQFAQEMGGQMSGSFYFLGTGASLDDMFATMRGDGRLFLNDGSLSALVVEAAGLDVAEALGVILTEDDAIAMPCAGISVTANDGEVEILRAEAVTTDSLIAAKGRANLDDLSYAVVLQAEAWDFSLLDLNAPVQISGVKSDYSLSIGEIEGIPLFAQGAQVSQDCDALVDRLNSQ